MPLPTEINHEHVRWESERVDFGSLRGLSVGVYDENGRPVIRHAMAWPATRQVAPPKFQVREMSFEVRDRPDDPDSPVRYVTQEVRVVVEPEVREARSEQELAEEERNARAKLEEFLRHVAWAGQLLAVGGGV
jgi:hypothetical protein